MNKSVSSSRLYKTEPNCFKFLANAPLLLTLRDLACYNERTESRDGVTRRLRLRLSAPW